MEKVPRLAICVNLGKDIGPMLFHCDDAWNVLGTSGSSTVESVKARAEENYPGVSKRWVDLNTSSEEALQYYDAHSDGLRCSFCGKRPFEIQSLVEGKSANICGSCVEEFHESLNQPDAPDSDAG